MTKPRKNVTFKRDKDGNRDDKYATIPSMYHGCMLIIFFPYSPGICGAGETRLHLSWSEVLSVGKYLPGSIGKVFWMSTAAGTCQ